MKNKKGFTLIELLAVIAILGIVITITGISVSGVLKKSKSDVSDIEMKSIEHAAELYVTKNRKLCKNGCTIDVQTLISEGYLDGNNDMIGTIDVTKTDGKYNYTLNFNSIDFAYTGNVQEITLPKGTYKLEVWGAQGGGSTYHSTSGGKGGYSSGSLTLSTATTLYIYVGGKGNTGSYNVLGGWNGGGGITNSYYSGGTGNHLGTGGGASDISLVGGDCTLDSYNRYVRSDESYNGRIIVAGGGGGSEGLDGTAGGGTTGINDNYGLFAGNNSSAGSFSYGSQSSDTWVDMYSGYLGYGVSTSGGHTSHAMGSCGGGGYYGGGAYGYNGSFAHGYGGAGYVASSLTNAETIAGDQSFLSPTGESETGHSGNGYARITKQ